MSNNNYWGHQITIGQTIDVVEEVIEDVLYTGNVKPFMDIAEAAVEILEPKFEVEIKAIPSWVKEVFLMWTSG